MNSELVNWGSVDTVLLDMDGTLLDLKFDNDFWLKFVPSHYARLNRLTFDQACEDLFPRMQSLRGTLDWYCVEFWSRELGLDIVAMKQSLRHRIQIRGGAGTFLESVRGSGRQLVLVTNAHERTLEIKLEQTGIGGFFHHLISAHSFGVPKESPVFWERLREHLDFEPQCSLFIDDSDAVLEAARCYGIAQVIAVANPDSSMPSRPHSDLPSFERFIELEPIPNTEAK